MAPSTAEATPARRERPPESPHTGPSAETRPPPVGEPGSQDGDSCGMEGSQRAWPGAAWTGPRALGGGVGRG